MEARTRTELSRAAFAAGVVTLFTAVVGASSLAAAEVYRWVDENGEVHYSESLPPDYKDRGFDRLNRDGLVIDENQKLTPEPPKEAPKEDEPQELPRDASGLPRPKALYSESEMQQRMDNFLMLRYESEQEILDAMEVEIKQLNYDRRLLEGSKTSMEGAYHGNLHIAADRQRAGLPVDDKMVKDIQKLRVDLARNIKSLDSLQQREDAIRADFQKQIDRYRYLIENYEEESAGG